MSKEYDGVTRANAETIFLKLKQMDEDLMNLALLSKNLGSITASINERLMVIERKLIEERIATMGTGPTED